MKITRNNKEFELTQEELESACNEFLEIAYIRKELFTSCKLPQKDAKKYSKIGYEKYRKNESLPLKETINRTYDEYDADKIIETMKENNLKNKRKKIKEFQNIKIGDTVSCKDLAFFCDEEKHNVIIIKEFPDNDEETNESSTETRYIGVEIDWDNAKDFNKDEYYTISINLKNFERIVARDTEESKIVMETLNYYPVEIRYDTCTVTEAVEEINCQLRNAKLDEISEKYMIAYHIKNVDDDWFEDNEFIFRKYFQCEKPVLKEKLENYLDNAEIIENED